MITIMTMTMMTRTTKKNDADGDLIFADGEAWRYDEITKERWSREEDKVLEVGNSFDCYADEAAFLEQFKPIFDSQRRFLLGRCSPGAASRAIEVLQPQKCSAIYSAKKISTLL